jgi:DNA-binding NarL/FixJ family response regulator
MSTARTDGDRIRVLVVDDQQLVRTGFRLILGAEPDLEVVGEAGDGREAIARAEALAPDVILMDVRMPEVDGIEATRQILGRARPPAAAGATRTPRVLILTTFDLDEYVYDALGAGASGFLLKDTPPEELAYAVRVVAAGEALIAPSITRRLIERFAVDPAHPPAVAADRPRVTSPVGAGDGDGRPGVVDARREEIDRYLTDREREVFELMARGLSNAEIAGSLLVGEATVKTHVGRVLAKLGLRDRVQAVVLAYETGLVTPGS